MHEPTHEQDPPSWDGSVNESELAEEDLFADELDYGFKNDAGTGPSWGLIIGAVIAIAAIAFLVFDGLNSETYFFDADVAVERSEELVGEVIRVRGTVEPGTFQGSEGSLDNRFRISEQGVSLAVQFQRALPDTFQEGTEVVAQGRLDESFVLHADEVLVKCPSRYEGAPPTGQPAEQVEQSSPPKPQATRY